MPKLLNRPDYVQYDNSRIEDGNFTLDDIKKLEEEPALLQWRETHAFDFHHSAIKTHSIILSVIWVPLTSLSLYYQALHFFCTFSIMFMLIFGVIYYIERSAYYDMAFKMTESGILLDSLKRFPKWRYRRQDPTKFTHFMRITSLILIVLALLVNPLLLAGAAGAIFVSFAPIRVDEPTLAIYIPIYWNKLDDVEDNIRHTSLRIFPKIRRIRIENDRSISRLDIYYSRSNLEQVMAIIKRKIPDVWADYELKKTMK